MDDSVCRQFGRFASIYLPANPYMDLSVHLRHGKADAQDASS